MSGHPELPFNPHTLARLTDPDTSHEAAASAESLRTKHHQQILSAFFDLPGVMLAAEQIADLIGLDMVAVCRRLHELERSGILEKTGSRHINRSGRGAAKYRRKPA